MGTKRIIEYFSHNKKGFALYDIKKEDFENLKSFKYKVGDKLYGEFNLIKIPDGNYRVVFNFPKIVIKKRGLKPKPMVEARTKEKIMDKIKNLMIISGFKSKDAEISHTNEKQTLQLDETKADEEIYIIKNDPLWVQTLSEREDLELRTINVAVGLVAPSELFITWKHPTFVNTPRFQEMILKDDISMFEFMENISPKVKLQILKGMKIKGDCSHLTESEQDFIKFCMGTNVEDKKFDRKIFKYVIDKLDSVGVVKFWMDD